MLKVCDLTSKHHSAVKSLSTALLNNIPADTFQITDSLRDAECVLVYSLLNDADGISETQLHHPLISGAALSMENIDQMREAIESLENTHKIVLLDQFYQDSVHQYPSFIRDTDLVVNFSNIPPKRKNTVTWIGIESRKFYPIHGVPCIPRSAIISGDHASLNPALFEVLVETLDHITVTLQTDFQHPSPKVHNHYVENYPDEMRYELNRHEYVIHLQDQKGPEIMGIEGGLCGTKPIYPGNQTYQAMYGDVDGVELFDLQNPAESLRSILTKETPYDWHDAFVERFSAENNVPEFWQAAKAFFAQSQ